MPIRPRVLRVRRGGDPETRLCALVRADCVSFYTLNRLNFPTGRRIEQNLAWRDWNRAAIVEPCGHGKALAGVDEQLRLSLLREKSSLLLRPSGWIDCCDQLDGEGFIGSFLKLCKLRFELGL